MAEESVLKFHKVAPVRIFEQAVGQIREMILRGEITPGQKLPTEQELCRELNASRSSIREALRVLEAEGLVEVKRGSGTFVTAEPTSKRSQSEVMQWLSSHEQTLEQVLEVRESIEGLTASLAAQRATEAQLAEVLSILDDHKRQLEKVNSGEEVSYDLLANLDAAFHLAIAGAGGNDIANEIISQIVPAFTQSNKMILYVSQRMPRTKAEHEEIYVALINRDPQAAEKAMREHLKRVRSEVIQLKSPPVIE